MLTRSLIFTLLAVLTSTVLKAQNLYSGGNGSEENPYQISNTTDWNTFAQAVSGGTNYSGVFFKLTEDITITVNNTTGSDKIAGEWTNFSTYKAFSGTFDGNGKTITFNVGAAGAGNEYVPDHETPNAPFRVIKGATIENLYVTGNIYPKYKYNAGLVGFAYDGGTNTIRNCTSTIHIDCSYLVNQGGGDTSGDYKKWDSSSGGLVTELKAGTLTLENCIFDGSITKGTNAYANRAAGFVGYNGSTTNTTITYNNCVMAGTIDMCNPSSPKGTLSTFNRNGHNSYSGTCLYCAGYGDVPKPNCAQASTVADGVYKKYTVSGTDYYVPVTVTPELKDMYYESSDPMTITLSYYGEGGKTLEAGTDYTILIEKKNNGVYETVSAITGPSGSYRVTLTSLAGSGFEGSKVYTFRLLDDDEHWQILVDTITKAASGSTITLQNDYVAMAGDNALLIPAGKTLTINLNGHTIDRNLSEAANYGQVIRIEAGATLNLVGPGTITGGYSKAIDKTDNPKNDAGGIHNMGTLTLTDVTVTNNKCIKNPDEATNSSATARGGGIYTGDGSSFTMTGGTLTGNVARGGGGGIYCYKTAHCSLTGVVISNNESESKGGGIRIKTDNQAAADSVYLTNCTIISNRATETNPDRSSDGGGVYMHDGKLSMKNCTIGCTINHPGTPQADTIADGNKSAFAGAGFYQNTGVTYAQNCTIMYNSAYTEHDRMYGGGVCLYGGTYIMDGGTISENHSYQDGGGIYIRQGAKFKVKGNVQIFDNFRTRTIDGSPNSTENNAYTAGSSVIEIIGPIPATANIRITGHGLGGIYTKGLDTYHVPDGVFKSDDKYVYEIDEEKGEIRLVPYCWTDEGAWYGQSWYSVPDHMFPTPEDDVVILRAIMIPENTTVYANTIDYTNGTLLIKEGGQLILTQNVAADNPVEMMLQKTIEAVEDDYGWYAISIPIEEAVLKNDFVYNTNLRTVVKVNNQEVPTFDLLRYDEPTHYWDSYTDDDVLIFGNTLTKGCGYLYRNANTITTEFFGYMNTGDVTYNVTYTSTVGGTPNKLAGWNLIGNPYSHTIYKGTGGAIPNGELLATGFYTLTKEGAWHVGTDNVDAIGICQGILVKANTSGTITMVNTLDGGPSSNKRGAKNIMFSISGSKYEDVAYAMFDEGAGLNKIEHINKDIPMVYIHLDNEDYAIATMEKERKSFNLNFVAKTTGRYTLSVKPEGDIGYLHIIDCLTGEDIDMLKEQEYSFIASINDDDSRFIVLLSDKTDANDDDFAYQSGNSIVVSGEGELQVFDVMGRMVATQYIDGVGIWRPVSVQTSVYILKLDNKIQKIIVK